MDPKVTINFPCSKCEAPIQLDAGFSHLSEHTKAELALPVFHGSEFVLPTDHEVTSLDKLILPLSFSNDAATNAMLLHSNITGLDASSCYSSPYGYTVLGCPSSNAERTPALKVTSELLDLASTNSSVDHPLCEECTDTLLVQVEEQLKFTAAKALSYAKLLEELQQVPLPETDHLEQQLIELEEEEAALEAEVQQLVEDQRTTELLLTEKLQQAQVLADEEERYQIEYCKQRSLWFDAEEERISFHNQKVHSHQQLEKLKQTNIFNIAFHIWKDNHISTINNFRVGRLPTMQVSWAEINAALGQMALLLVALTRKFDLKFSRYRIVPYGNHSYIEVKGSDNRFLPLYTHTGLISIFDHAFDLAMTAFLECFGELVQYLSLRTNATLNLPYPIVKNYLEDPQTGNSYCIKIQFNPDEQWTKALKFLLTNMKWVLTFMSVPAFSQQPQLEAAPSVMSSSSSRSVVEARQKQQLPRS